MKRYILSAVAAFTCTFAAVSVAPAQTALFSYDDHNGAPAAGTYFAGTSFTFSISLAFTPGGAIANLEGLSYWFEQQNPSAPFNFSITLRDVTGSQFTFLQTPGLTYPQNMTPQNASDLGGSLQTNAGVGAGNYFIADITVSIAPGAANGVYTIENTTTGGKKSVISDNAGHTFAIPAAFYTITVVPEPSTWAGAALAASSLGFFGIRRRRVKKS
jgi:hypothetical protein